MHVIPLRTQRAIGHRNRFRRRIIFATILVNALGYVLAIWLLAQSRQAYQSHAETTAHNVAKMLKHNVTAALQTVELNLFAAKAEIERQQIINGLQPDPSGARALHLSRAHPGMKDIEVVVPDNSGESHQDASGQARPQTASAVFQFLRDQPLAGLLISKSPTSRSNDEMLLSRRFNRPDGSFGGILNYRFNLSALKSMFASLDVGANGVVSLWNRELGTIASHSPSPAAKPHAFIPPAPGEQALFVDASPADKMMRTTAVHQISGFPLYVSVGLATEDYLATWWQSLAATGESLLFFTLMTSLIALWAYHTRSAHILSVTPRCPVRAPRCHRSPFRSQISIPFTPHLRPTGRREKISPVHLTPMGEDAFAEN